MHQLVNSKSTKKFAEIFVELLMIISIGDPLNP